MSTNLESELRMSLKAMMCDMQSPNPFKSLDEKKAIIERHVQDLLDMLQENYGQVHEQDEHESYSRWHQLFGTPERAAKTLTNVCQFTHGGELCDRCQTYLFDSCDWTLRLGSEQKIYDALLKWLKQEVNE